MTLELPDDERADGLGLRRWLSLRLHSEPRTVLQWLSRAACWASIALTVVYGFLWHLGETAYDDSYFFKRFALNFLQHGTFAWNVADGPVHGATSQVFQVLTTIVTAVAPDQFITGVKVLNALCLFGFGWVLLRACERAAEDSGGARVLALLVLSAPVVVGSLGTGMETALALLVLGASLSWMVRALEASPRSPGAAYVAALLTVLVYLSRPDAAMIPGVVFVLSHVLARRVPWRYLGALAALMALLLVFFRWYYGTALPLPFYLKTYPPQGIGWVVKRWHIGASASVLAPFVWLAWRRRDPITLSLTAAGVLFFAYHAGLTEEVMGYRGRFYAPSLVPFALAAARSWDAFVSRARVWPTLLFCSVWAALVVAGYRTDWLPTGDLSFIEGGIPWPAYAAGVAAGAALLLPSTWPRARVLRGLAIPILAFGLLRWLPYRPPELLTDEQTLRRYASHVTTLRGLFDVQRCLPDAKNVYHSEMGVTGLVLMNARVVDMVGLLSREILLEGASFEQYCSRDRPEAIFLPNRNYIDLNAAVRSSTCIKDYKRVVRWSASPLYVRKDLVRSFLGCAKEIKRWR